MYMYTSHTLPYSYTTCINQYICVLVYMFFFRDLLECGSFISFVTLFSSHTLYPSGIYIRIFIITLYVYMHMYVHHTYII